MADGISCLIPAYNVERYLGAAIDSVLAQTAPAAEIVVVDDGSTDGTAAVAERYGDRVRLVRTLHQGYTRARDAALAAARGSFIAYLDADDLWLPGKLERQLEVFAADPVLDLCVTRFVNFWEPELATEEARYRGHPLAEPMAGYVVPTLLARREVFDRVGGFAAAGSDTGWFARAAAEGVKIEFLEDVLMRRRFHPGNHSRTELPARSLFDLIKIRLDAKRGSRSG